MRSLLFVVVAATALAGCEAMQSMWGGGPKATASLQPTKGSTVRGTVNFEQRGDKVRVAANVSGLRPNGEFGFHVHEIGDCSSGDGMSTKGHFNPFGKPHGHHGSARAPRRRPAEPQVRRQRRRQPYGGRRYHHRRLRRRRTSWARA